mmetsp:Transcript_10742/g.27248  ORF Transcript_10742/g.27248 Transcript_10742/m.27248 type:complete len:285 (+) Transcript_10742:158-1012(+)
MGKRRKSQPAEVTPAEAERRRKQREKQAMAISLRESGKAYAPPKKSRPPKWEREAAKSGVPRKRKGKEDEEGPGRGGAKMRGAPAEEPGSGKLVTGDIEVIVIPLFWKQREEERQAITDAALEVRKLLGAARVPSFVDFSNKLNPGQKYRYWEERGVKLRVELGPKDLEANSCVLAVCTKPGEVAQKSSVGFWEELLAAVGTALGRSLRLQDSSYEPQPFAKPAEAPKGKHVAFDNEEEEEAEGHAGGADTRRSGDDLGDEFDLGGGEETKRKKKQKLSKHVAF